MSIIIITLLSSILEFVIDGVMSIYIHLWKKKHYKRYSKSGHMIMAYEAQKI